MILKQPDETCDSVINRRAKQAIINRLVEAGFKATDGGRTIERRVNGRHVYWITERSGCFLYGFIVDQYGRPLVKHSLRSN